MKSANEPLEGFFITFEHRELEDVKKALDLLGYTQDGEGMKELLLDALFGDQGKESGTEIFIKKAREYIKTNPETITLGLSALKLLADKFRKPPRQ